MPASYVHQCIASDAAKKLGLFENARLHAALRAGSEGPDPFFFSLRPGRPYAPALGSAMHDEKTADFLLRLVKRADTDLLRAYVCGFFAHYATDTTFHPFVYAHSLDDAHHVSSTIHCTLEHQWETMLYRAQGHAAGLPVQMGGFADLDNAALSEIAAALTPAAAEVYPTLALPLSRVRASLTDAVLLCRLLRSENGKKYTLLGGVLSPFKLDAALHSHMMPLHLPKTDFVNAAHAPWASLWEPERTRTEGFAELYESAVARAAELMRCVLGYWDGRIDEAALRACHGDFSYDSGLPWEKTCTPAEAAAKAFGNI